MNYIFLDTNIYIHFIDFESISWKQVVSDEGEFTIVFTPKIIEELDKYKNNHGKRASSKVRNLLPRIEQSISGDRTTRFPILFHEKPPSDETLKANHMEYRQYDHIIVASMLEFRSTIGENDRIYFVSHDTGPRITARSRGIVAIDPGEKYLAAVEPDETEKELKEVKKKLQEHENRMPVLKVCFPDGSNLLTATRATNVQFKNEFIAQQMEIIRSKHPLLEYQETFRKHGALSNLQIAEYNKELKDFYGKWEECIGSAYDRFEAENRSIKIELVLINTGTFPATDIDIHFHYPDGFELIEEDNFPEIKSEPNAPYKPQNSFDSGHINWDMLSPMQQPEAPLPIFDTGRPEIKKTNSYDVTYHLEGLKHNMQEALNPIYAVFEDLEQATGFTIEYRLNIANMVNEVRGKLHVRFEEDSQNLPNIPETESNE